jgi:hypothetical protein
VTGITLLNFSLDAEIIAFLAGDPYNIMRNIKGVKRKASVYHPQMGVLCGKLPLKT